MSPKVSSAHHFVFVAKTCTCVVHGVRHAVKHRGVITISITAPTVGRVSPGDATAFRVHVTTKLKPPGDGPPRDTLLAGGGYGKVFVHNTSNISADMQNLKLYRWCVTT